MVGTMAVLTAAVTRRASMLLRPAASAASIRPMSSSSANIRALRTEVASLRAKDASCRVKADALLAASHDSEVICVIQSTMQFQERSLAEKIPRDFPFQIERDGSTDINLTRSLKGEQIEVLVSMPILKQKKKGEQIEVRVSMPILEQDESSSSDEYTSYSVDEDEGSTETYTVPLTVTVSKADGSSLQLYCNAYPDRVVINALCIAPLIRTSEASYNFASFSLLDVNVRDAFYRYLEIRGITAVNGKILYEHMISKHQRPYLLWLDKLSDFVQKD